MSDENVTMKDRFAMTISAFVMLVLPCILILVGMCLIMMWIFRIL